MFDTYSMDILDDCEDLEDSASLILHVFLCPINNYNIVNSFSRFSLLAK